MCSAKGLADRPSFGDTKRSSVNGHVSGRCLPDRKFFSETKRGLGVAFSLCHEVFPTCHGLAKGNKELDRAKCVRGEIKEVSDRR